MRTGEREAARLTAGLRSHQRRLVEAQAIIRAHPRHLICTSWGKDSTALLAVAAETLPRVVAMNIRYPNKAERFSDIDRVRDAALRLLPTIEYVEVECPGEWEMYERVGHGFIGPQTAEERAAVCWWRDEMNARTRVALDRLGATGLMWGLRAGESRGRRGNIRSRGMSYVRKDGLAVALPLAWWRGPDVWAVLVTRGLPWLRIYDEAEAGRDRARSGFVFATGSETAHAFGATQDWERVYPAEFRAWVAAFPELGDLRG